LQFEPACRIAKRERALRNCRKGLRDREHASKIHTRMYDVKRSDPGTGRRLYRVRARRKLETG
jgi:hypothetical protein